jgi:hypothetical protein
LDRSRRPFDLVLCAMPGRRDRPGSARPRPPPAHGAARTRVFLNSTCPESDTERSKRINRDLTARCRDAPRRSGPGAARMVPGTPQKSDLRNHQAIVHPRLCDCVMVTQITLKTEGPHGQRDGLPSGRLPLAVPAEVDPPDGEVLFHLSRLRCGQRLSLERSEPCANAAARERGGWSCHTGTSEQ